MRFALRGPDADLSTISLDSDWYINPYMRGHRFVAYMNHTNDKLRKHEVS